MEKGKKIIGIVLILVSIAALFTWEKWGKNRFLYEDVLAFSQNVEKGTVITEDMISTVKMDIGEEDQLKSADKKSIIFYPQRSTAVQRILRRRRLDCR